MGLKKVREKEKNNLRNLSLISLWLDRYDEIFSDFDPRPFSQRALSDDFLTEAKKVSRETTSGNIMLELLVPKKRRNKKDEAVIKRRLKEYFKKHYVDFLLQVRGIKKQGLFFVVLGTILMLVGTYLVFKHYEKTLLVSFLIVLLEPAGWFTFWEGLNLLIFGTQKLSHELKFFEKISHGKIIFMDY